ncbi:MAG: glycoside hydrolase family 16 protein [Crocinitomicaceae bacterium]|nr:glycoside hydrolase family 16 protein [Crocinitomicaceae bacterium]
MMKPCRLSLLHFTAALLFTVASTAQPHYDTLTITNGGIREMWDLVFFDEFSGEMIDESKWKIVEGVPRDPMQQASEQWYDPRNIIVSDGIAKFQVRKDTMLNKPFSIWIKDGMKEMKGNYYFSSGEIDSRELFHYGLYEIRCKLPKGKGMWPAFWMYGESDGTNNEIDVFEFWNQSNVFGLFSPKKLSRIQNMTVHYRGGMSGLASLPGTDYSDGFHTFSVIWDECKIQWYTDGKLMRTQYRFKKMKGRKSGCDEVKDGGKENVFPRSPMNIIIDLAVQNGDARPDETNSFPNALEVDYVRYYQKAGEQIIEK